MKSNLNIFLLLISNLISWYGFAQKAIILSDTTKIINIGKSIDLYEDKIGSQAIEQISSMEFENNFKPSKEDVPNFGTTNSKYGAE